ncbi:type II secretion system F family protein [Variovorax rhizosphaerae]|uniref:General secretion pathway protein F n=1 Tax=Variovorax rhizosphaerae TaxID=1836200 RepID=A0ABU8WYS1_9BURK
MRYKVKVLAQGQLQERDVDAPDENDLRRQLVEQGLQLVGWKAQKQFSLRKTEFGISLFTQELIALLEAGLTLVEGIETLKEKSAHDTNRIVLGRIEEGLYQGLTFSRVLSQMPEYFPPLYIATVSSAEQTGHLADALKRYHHYDSRLSVVRKKVVSAMIYPLVIISTGAGIILFLLFYVIPKFSQIYASMKNIPFSAQVMLWWGEQVQAHGMMMFIGIVGTMAGIVFFLRSDAVRQRIMASFWRLPRLGEYQRLFALTRFYRTVSLLLAGGVSVVGSMEMAEQLLAPNMRAEMKKALVDIKSGQSVSATLPRYGMTTPVSERLLRVGEQGGDLSAMFERSAQFCDEEVDRAIDLVTKLVEPVLMLVVGGLVGVIVFLLYMPIFQLAGSV